MDMSRQGILMDKVDLSPEAGIIITMVNNDTISATKAVEDIVAITSNTAAKVPAEADEQDENYRALRNHAENTAHCIVLLAQNIMHSQQGKLIDFTLFLQRASVPDPKNGGLSCLGKLGFWLDMPELSSKIARFYCTPPPAPGFTEELQRQDQQFENVTAFVAQLSEVGFLTWKENLTWNYYHMAWIFHVGRPVVKRDVRLLSLWLIYAPTKVWLDIELKHKRQFLNTVDQFPSDYWFKWKRFLKKHQAMNTEETSFLDDETQELIRTALEQMEMTEQAQTNTNQCE